MPKLAATCAIFFLTVTSSALAASAKTIKITPGHCVTVATTRVCAVAAPKPVTTPTATPATYYATTAQAEKAIDALGAWNGVSFATATFYTGASCFGTFTLTQHHNAAGEQTFAAFKCDLVITPQGSTSPSTYDLLVTTNPDGTFSIKPA